MKKFVKRALPIVLAVALIFSLAIGSSAESIFASIKTDKIFSFLGNLIFNSDIVAGGVDKIKEDKEMAGAIDLISAAILDPSYKQNGIAALLKEYAAIVKTLGEEEAREITAVNIKYDLLIEEVQSLDYSDAWKYFYFSEWNEPADMAKCGDTVADEIARLDQVLIDYADDDGVRTLAEQKIAYLEGLEPDFESKKAEEAKNAAIEELEAKRAEKLQEIEVKYDGLREEYDEELTAGDYAEMAAKLLGVTATSIGSGSVKLPTFIDVDMPDGIDKEWQIKSVKLGLNGQAAGLELSHIAINVCGIPNTYTFYEAGELDPAHPDRTFKTATLRIYNYSADEEIHVKVKFNGFLWFKPKDLDRIYTLNKQWDEVEGEIYELPAEKIVERIQNGESLYFCSVEDVTAGFDSVVEETAKTPLAQYLKASFLNSLVSAFR